MALLVGYGAILLPICVWFAWTVTANKNSIPVWTWLDGSTQVNQPSLLTTGAQYPGCRADSGIWTRPIAGVVWMFGGRDGSGAALNELWMYNMPTQKWTNIQRGREQEWPSARYGLAVCGVQGSPVVIYGGAESAENHLSDTWLYHLHNKSWTLLAGSSRPGIRDIKAHWCTHDALWIYGSTTADHTAPLTMWRFSLGQYNWMQVGEDIDGGKSQGRQWLKTASWSVNGTLLYILGRKQSHADESCQGETINQCDLWRFSTISNHWENIATHPEEDDRRTADDDMVEPEKHPNCLANTASWLDVDSNLWLLGNGGETEDPCEEAAYSSSDLWMLDLRLRWVRYELGYRILEGIPGILDHPPPRVYCASWSWNSTYYLFGGLARNGTVGALNDLWDFHLLEAESLRLDPTHPLAVPPVAVFFLSLGALGLLSLFVFSIIFFSKCSSGPRLKPPNHFGDKIRYSPVEVDEVFIT